jgi:2-methylisocitrate lyase-like PEP mutase family enzyme
MTELQRERAERLRQLHHGPPSLVLPNAWDAASARIYELAGFPAIATTSAGIAFAHGYHDGERIPRAEMLAAIERIARTVEVPVTADIERGFGSSIGDLERTIAAVIEAGAVGLNLEDGIGGDRPTLRSIDDQIQRVRAVRELGERLGVPVVINARTDVFLREIGEPDGRVSEAIRRGRAYHAAGADCIFVPGVTDPVTIARLVSGLGAPLNVLAVAGTPPIAALEELGVARVSVGSGPMRATLALVAEIAEELGTAGTYSTFANRAMAMPLVNRVMEDAARRLQEHS